MKHQCPQARQKCLQWVLHKHHTCTNLPVNKLQLPMAQTQCWLLSKCYVVFLKENNNTGKNYSDLVGNVFGTKVCQCPLDHNVIWLLTCTSKYSPNFLVHLNFFCRHATTAFQNNHHFHMYIHLLCTTSIKLAVLHCNTLHNVTWYMN